MTLSRRFFRLVPSGLVIAAGFASGCTNFDRFTAGRMPYGSVAENGSPRDPFLGQTDGNRTAGTSTQSTPQQSMVAQTSWNGQPPSGDGMLAYPAGPQTAMQPSSFQQQQPAYQQAAFAQSLPQDQQFAPQQQPYAQQQPYSQQTYSQQTYSQQQAYAPQTGFAQSPNTLQPQGYPAPQGYAQQTMPAQQPSSTVQQPSSYQAAYLEQPPNPFATAATGSGIQQMSYEMPAAPPSNPFAEVEGMSAGMSTAPAYAAPTMNAANSQWQPAPAPAAYPSEAFLPPMQR